VTGRTLRRPPASASMSGPQRVTPARRGAIIPRSVRYVAFVSLLTAGCASRPDLPPDLTGETAQTEVPAGPTGQDRRVVAFVNGEPVTWRQVADRAMTLSGRDLIDQYIAAKLREDVLRRNAIANTPDDLRARAEAIVAAARRTQGDERVNAALREQGLTEAQYVQRFVDDPLFAERLLTEKAVVFTLLSEPTIDVEFVAGADEKEVERFVAAVDAGATFAKAAESARGLRVSRQRLARGFLHAQMAHLEDALFRLKDGERTGLERTLSNVAVVARVQRAHAADPRPYAETRDVVLAEILRSPPGEEQIKMWTERLFRGSKIHYEDRYSARDKK